MEREAQVVHAIVAVGEAEINVSSAELDSLHFAVCMFIATDDRRIIDRFAALALEYAALYPYLVGTG